MNLHHWFAALVVLVCLAADGFGQEAATDAGAPPRRQEPNAAFAQVVDDPALPRVLLIGDSISIGYTVPVRELLQGKANVHRIPTNGGPTTKGLEQIEDWLGDGRWDVIHFNWGLHDLKYMDEKGQLADVNVGRQQVPLAEYERNLRQLVTRLEQTGARLIWRSTTPVPEGAAGRIPEDAGRYNAVAAAIMQERGIPIDDQYTFALPRLGEIQLPANVHFTKDGSRELAAQAVKSIEAALRPSQNE
ncbi:MAG: SGNH/GDSL hydrolase family protein [Planctomycetaceae bacterium]|nr:SGNH/GDSL hydrolase family protein [Planctomycetaceae bacterium]